MFEPQPFPRVLAVPPGEDFPRAFVEGLLARLQGTDPFAAARVQVLVNTNRTGRRITRLLAESGARLLPRITPVAELAAATALPGMGLPVPPLRRRLQLNRIVLALLDRQPDLAPRSAAFDLAESLSRLIDEMHEEQVSPDRLISRDFGELSRHWERSVEILSIVSRYFGPGSDAEATPAARLEAVVARLAGEWERTPPDHPVIVAGSTGSRGTTFRLMQAVARLPHGAVVLPGYDFAQPDAVWRQILETNAEEHPQYRLARLRQTLGLESGQVRPWTAAESSPRNALISLSLRPAPVSDQWIVEGPLLGDLGPATEGMTLIEAPDVRTEALAIATALRQSVAEGRSAAVVTPDRNLTRRVAAELGRWHIAADDSAGEPLALTPRGRLLRHAAEVLVAPPRIEDLLVILKHPLTHSGGGRTLHLRRVRALDLALRRDGRPRPGAEDLLRLVGNDDPGAGAWAEWIAATLIDIGRPARRPLAEHLRRHIAMVEALAAGTAPEGEDRLWSGTEGTEALRVMSGLEREAEHGGTLTATEYRDLIGSLLMSGEVRQSAEAHPLVRFWGTLEARVQGADLVILAGLNEGLWPAHPPPDPWMNRRMRREVGLTSPERRTGLSAHDYQQAITSSRVILTRSVRDESAQTVPSRWLGRLVGLLEGLEAGRPALKAMRTRGNDWLSLAKVLDRPAERQTPARRPAPRPPVTARPTRLSVTEIQKLIRDPYAIYARHVLRLKPVDQLRPRPDARISGTLIHSVLEVFVKSAQRDPSRLDATWLLHLADAELEKQSHWPGMRHIWRGRIEAFAPWFAGTEAERQAQGTPVIIEDDGRLLLSDPPFTLTGTPDRIDRLRDGSLEIFDYKTGALPTKKAMTHFDRQLLLLALMAERGAFAGVDGPVSRVAHIGLGRDLKVAAVPLEPGETERTADELSRLLASYLDPNKGFPSRRAQEGNRWDGDYDHLARYGEWTASDAAEPEDIG